MCTSACDVGQQLGLRTSSNERSVFTRAREGVAKSVSFELTSESAACYHSGNVGTIEEKNSIQINCKITA